MPPKIEVEKVEYIYFRVQEVSRLTSVISPVISIKGVPWTVSVCKETADDDEKLLRIYLDCKKDGRAKWSFIASASFLLIPFDSKDECDMVFLQPAIFDREQSTWGEELIDWNDLMDPTKSYIQNDTINIRVGIEASKNRDDSITWEKVRSRKGMFKYRMSIKNIKELTNVRSPAFPINEHPFVVEVVRTKQAQRVDDIKEYLAAYLRCLETSQSDWVCKTQLFFTILPFNMTGKPFKRSDTTFDQFDKDNLCFGWSDMLEWSTFQRPQNNFVKKNGAVFEFEIQNKNVSRSNEPPLAISAPIDADNCAPIDAINCVTMDANVNPKPSLIVALECLLCAQNMFERVTSATECGHLFCTACIVPYVEEHKSCPNCNKNLGRKNVESFTIPR